MRILIFTLVLLLASTASAADWIFAPSTYTHKNGERVTQYAEPEPAYTPDYSQYRHHVYIYQDNRGHYYRRDTWRYPPYYHHPYWRYWR